MIYENSSSLFGGRMDDDDIQVSDSLFEAFLIDECSKFTDEQRQAFVESELAETLVQEGRMRRNTIVRIGQNDDLKRREVLASLDMAKETNDPEYAKYKKHRMEMKKSLAKIVKKFQFKAARVAKASQKDYIKNRMPKSFGKITDFGNSNR